MRLIITTALILVSIGLTSCVNSNEPVAPPYTSEQLTQLRDEYRRANPVARVGVVTAVLPDSHLAAVGSVPLKDFTVGDVVTFLDSNRKSLTMGTVIAITKTSLTIRYADPDPKVNGSRIPNIGDAAVRAFH